MDKIKLAIITSYGMDKGGTEKFLQIVACNLVKYNYIVDYYYIDTISERVSNVKKELLKKSGVNLIPYQTDEIIFKCRYISQINSNFFEVYKGGYDLILTGSCGLPEEPLTKIKNIPIVQTIHYVSGVDNQYNIARVLHISEFSKNMWVKKGGDVKRTEMISHPIEIPHYNKMDLRKNFGINDKCVIYGMHQRDNDYIFSPIPLAAYKKIENENNAYILCGGSKKYREQAKELQLKNCYFIDATDNNDVIYSFLDTIDIYAHGRFDGELNSTALAEAMYFGLPILSHPSEKYNGHLEVIKDNGYVASDIEQYAENMKILESDIALREKCGNASREIYNSHYETQSQIKHLINIFENVLDNPYPNKLRRRYRGLKNTISNKLKIQLITIRRNRK